jgi:putative SOS response-associated peptidase YedK
MPSILATPAEIDCWMNGPIEEAQKLQRPMPDDALVIVSCGTKEDAGRIEESAEQPSLL